MAQFARPHVGAGSSQGVRSAAKQGCSVLERLTRSVTVEATARGDGWMSARAVEQVERWASELIDLSKRNTSLNDKHRQGCFLSFRGIFAILWL